MNAVAGSSSLFPDIRCAYVFVCVQCMYAQEVMAKLQGSPLHSSAWLSWVSGTKSPGLSQLQNSSMAPIDSTPAPVLGPP